MPPTHSSDLLESHETNKTVLTTVAPTLSSPAPAPSPSPPNPLLSRIKLKPARKPKPKSKKALVGQVAQAKASELAVIDAGGAAGGEEAEVLDLADQLLEQLEAQDSQNAEAPATSGGAMHIENATVGRGGGEGDSGGSTKDKLHELKEDLKEKLRISGNEGAVVVEKKVSRQQARKVRSPSPTQELHVDLACSPAEEVLAVRLPAQLGTGRSGGRERPVDSGGAESDW